MMKILVLTSEPISAEDLRRALPDGVEPADLEVMVVAPALHKNALQFWFSDADEAIKRAEAVQEGTVEQLSAQGVPAAADTGEGDPVDAVEDALQTFSAERILLFTHPEGERRYREDVDEAELRERFGLPVDHAVVSG
jgi:hypothetical protein